MNIECSERLYYRFFSVDETQLPSGKSTIPLLVLMEFQTKLSKDVADVFSSLMSLIEHAGVKTRHQNPTCMKLN